MIKTRAIEINENKIGTIEEKNLNIDNIWKLRGIEEGFIKLSCKVGEREFYISATRSLGDKLRENKMQGTHNEAPLVNGSFESFKIIPLYRNCLLSEINDKDKDSTEVYHCVYINSKEDIGTIQFSKCTLVTPIISDTDENRVTHNMAFIIRTTMNDKYVIKVFNIDKTLTTITEDNVVTSKVSHEIKKPLISFHGPKYVIIPKNTVFVKDIKKNKRDDEYIPVKIDDVLNDRNIYRKNGKSTNYIFDEELTTEEINRIKIKLELEKPSEDKHIRTKERRQYSTDVKMRKNNRKSNDTNREKRNFNRNKRFK